MTNYVSIKYQGKWEYKLVNFNGMELSANPQAAINHASIANNLNLINNLKNNYLVFYLLSRYWIKGVKLAD